MSKTIVIYLMTHGEKQDGPNPGHTAKGMGQIREVQSLLPQYPSEFWIGTGERHLEMLHICQSLRKTKVPVRYSAVIGNPDSKEGDNIILADGTPVSAEMYENVPFVAVFDIISRCKHNAVVFAGEPAVMALLKFTDLPKPPEAKPAKVYRIELDFGGIKSFVCLN
jgi:hypothetical protein